MAYDNEKLKQVYEQVDAYIDVVLTDVFETLDEDKFHPYTVSQALPDWQPHYCVDNYTRRHEALREQAIKAMRDYYKACLMGDAPVPMP